MAANIDIPLRRNKLYTWDGVAQRRVGGVLQTIDLTDATIRLTVRKAIGADATMFELVSGAPIADGSIVIAPDQVADKGEYTLRVEAAATSDASEFPDDRMGYYPYEIELTNATGEPETLAYGDVKYAPDIR
ncbi:MAG: hypothetical protein H0U46_03160 [Actinobacteria bacterium]|nr:hypothetical protein [Actinomycetota bacterium]